MEGQTDDDDDSELVIPFSNTNYIGKVIGFLVRRAEV
jgi:hypothetical protein